MRFKLTLFYVLLSAGSVFAQSKPQPAFTPYADKMNEDFQAAYDKRDTAAARKLVQDFAARYDQLSADDKAWFSGNVLGAYYNLSCVYALTNNKQRAYQYLDSAIVRGYTNYKHLQEDSDFAGIRNDAGFKARGEKMRSVGDYMYILQHAAKYDNAQARPVPAFSYQPATAPELVALRKKFNLDSIAGNGPDSAKMINLLHWVHNTVNHDGQHESGITRINADEIVKEARTRKLGVSCGELATVLQDCYLAMGWKVRKVYCFPKDSLRRDYDSHVINVVYLPAKQKWVWLDPTNNAYVTNERGELLSIEEVRQRLIDGRPLNVNADANWNNRQQVVKENYLYNYMAKNLYLLYSPLRSEYDYQTPGKNKETGYVILLPLDYFKQTPYVSVDTAKDNSRKVSRYRINNEKQFWSVTNQH